MTQRERQTPSESQDIESIEASRARGAFRETLDRVAFGGRRLVIERNGKPIAALVPLGDLQQLRDYDLRRAEWMAAQDDHDDEIPTLTVEESLAAFDVVPGDATESEVPGPASDQLPREPLSVSLELSLTSAYGTERVPLSDDLARQILEEAATEKRKRSGRSAA